METLHVGLGKNSYDILIGENFFERFPEYIGEVYKGKKLFVITDSNVDRIYKNEYERMFKDFEYNVFVLQAGEKNKHIGIMPGIYSTMVMQGLQEKIWLSHLVAELLEILPDLRLPVICVGLDLYRYRRQLFHRLTAVLEEKSVLTCLRGKILLGRFISRNLF